MLLGLSQRGDNSTMGDGHFFSNLNYLSPAGVSPVVFHVKVKGIFTLMTCWRRGDIHKPQSQRVICCSSHNQLAPCKNRPAHQIVRNTTILFMSFVVFKAESRDPQRSLWAFKRSPAKIICKI